MKMNNLTVKDELTLKAVVSILETTAEDGKNYKTKYDNFDAILSSGYRVKQ